MSIKDGMNYAPVGKPQPVVGAGEFVIAAAAITNSPGFTTGCGFPTGA